MHTKITNKKMLQLKKREKTKQKKQQQPAKQVNLTLALATCKSQNDPIEFVQTKFIRWLLGVNKFCSSNACRSEVGRFPMRTKTKCRAIKYWLKFCEPEHQNKLSGIAFTDQIGQDKKELWSSKLKRLLKLAGLGDIWSAKTNTPTIMNYI